MVDFKNFEQLSTKYWNILQTVKLIKPSPYHLIKYFVFMKEQDPKEWGEKPLLIL